MDILEQLNKEQRQAVEAVEGPVMVIAGAGSGKTRVLTYRVAHLLNLGIDPFHILALTFTNKAAREMKERIIKLVGSADAKNVWMGTFHSVFARLLRTEGHRLGYPRNFSIYDSDDSKRLIRAIVKESNIDEKVYTPNYVLNRISAAKTNLITAEHYNLLDELLLQDKMAGKPHIGELYQKYKNRCFRSHAMDFDDLLLNTYLLFRDFPDVMVNYQNKFHFVLVDEYQDTNKAQYTILKQLAANNENICVVGDDAQSIYAFRGANIQNILNFKKDYPDAREFKLEQNYRSTKNIVNAANSIIKNNKDQIFKEIWTKNEEGNKIQLIRASSDNEEGQLIANSIFEQKMNNQLKNDGFAVLYRTNAQSRSIEEALRRLNIPYRIYGGLSFYNRKEIKDLLAYLRLAVNNRDEEALRRVINYPARGIGKTSQERIIVVAEQAGISQWEVVEEPSKYALNLNSGTLNKLYAFVTMIKSFSAQIKSKNAFEISKLIATSSGILKDLNEDKTPEGISRIENVEELLNAIKEFTENGSELVPGMHEEQPDNAIKTLDVFLQDVALITDADSQDKDNTDKVTLMTIHAAKGLEFPMVYVVGMEENLFPSIQSLGSRSDLEEERRLFYVACTRAENRLFLSYAQNRYRWGNLTICEPSRFLDEIDQQYIEFPRRIATSVKPDQSGPKTYDPPVSTKKLKKIGKNLLQGNTGSIDFDNDLMNKIQPGIEVAHNRFGRGKVISIEGDGANKKAAVFFKNVGQKQLLLKYAKLKIIE
ncbi:MAG: UvrD-helicase domain-containing protein [Bacteroidales bacterium]|nr:UvrD-helicase domain-containing protein [Bacteroidales bacterium]MCF8403405.1 UvrD-helicase domain-containing protein [Bacteroidales bacterium]